MEKSYKEVSSLHDRIREYITYYLPLVLKRSKLTVRAYVIGINSFRKHMRNRHNIEFTCLDFCHFSLKEVNEWLQYLKNEQHCMAATLNLRLAAIRGFMRYCSDRSSEHTALYNSIKEIREFKDEIKQNITDTGYDYLTPKQLKLLFSIPDAKNMKDRRNLFFMILAFETGARLSELLDMKLKNICDDNSLVKILIESGKGDKSRFVPIAKEVVSHLKGYLKEFHPDNNPNDYLFYTLHDGKKSRMHDSTPASFVKEYGKKAHKIDPYFPENIHVHMFRHSLGTQLVRNGVPLSYIADLFGHAQLETTRIYAKNDPKEICKAIEGANNDINKKLGKRAEGKKWANKEDELLSLCGLSNKN